MVKHAILAHTMIIIITSANLVYLVITNSIGIKALASNVNLENTLQVMKLLHVLIVVLENIKRLMDRHIVITV